MEGRDFGFIKRSMIYQTGIPVRNYTTKPHLNYTGLNNSLFVPYLGVHKLFLKICQI